MRLSVDVLCVGCEEIDFRLFSRCFINDKLTFNSNSSEKSTQNIILPTKSGGCLRIIPLYKFQTKGELNTTVDGEF